MWLNILYFISAAIMSAWAVYHDAKGAANYYSPSTNSAFQFFVRMNHALFAIIISFEPTVVVLFWALLYGGHGNTIYYFSNVSAHGMVAFFPAVDLALGNHTLPDNMSTIVLSAGIIYLFM